MASSGQAVSAVYAWELEMGWDEAAGVGWASGPVLNAPEYCKVGSSGGPVDDDSAGGTVC